MSVASILEDESVNQSGCVYQAVLARVGRFDVLKNFFKSTRRPANDGGKLLACRVRGFVHVLGKTKIKFDCYNQLIGSPAH